VAPTANVPITLSPSQLIRAVPMRGSVMVAFVSGTSPVFVTLNRYVMVPGGSGTVVEPDDFVRLSAATARGVATVAVLLAGTRSVTPAGNATVAVFVNGSGVPLAGAVPVTV